MKFNEILSSTPDLFLNPNRTCSCCLVVGDLAAGAVRRRATEPGGAPEPPNVAVRPDDPPGRAALFSGETLRSSAYAACRRAASARRCVARSAVSLAARHSFSTLASRSLASSKVRARSSALCGNANSLLSPKTSFFLQWVRREQRSKVQKNRFTVCIFHNFYCS